MYPIQTQMQNLNKQTIYPSFMNTSCNPQLVASPYISSTVNAVQDIPVAENTTTSNLTLSPLAYSQPTVDINKHSFFYAPCNDFQMYHIVCEEVPLTFEVVSQLINNTDNNFINNYAQASNIYVFYHEQPEIKKIYQVTCEMVSHTFMFQFLNKIIYGIQFTQGEHQQQEFSKKHQDNLKFHLKKDLIYYLTPKNHTCNSNTDALNHFQRYNANALLSGQSFANNGFQNGDSHNQGYHSNYFQP
jgi:hypothetical protein